MHILIFFPLTDGGLTERSLEKNLIILICVYSQSLTIVNVNPFLEFCLFSDSDTGRHIFEFVREREEMRCARISLTVEALCLLFLPFLLYNCKRIYSSFVAGLFTAASR